jgi:hypothetical protein
LDFTVQTQLCELALTPPSSTAGASEPPPTISDVWCQSLPIKITFNPHTSTYKNWLLVLSICHHIPAFTNKFLAMTKFDDMVSPMKNSRQWFINRIHFPHSLLENWSTHKIHRNQWLLPAAVAHHLSASDNNKTRMVEYVNTVPFLEGFGGRILPAAAIQLFQLSMLNMKTINPLQGHNYMQAPVGSLHEAQLHLSSLGSAASKRPPPKEVTPSAKKSKKEHTTESNNNLHFVDAIVGVSKVLAESPVKHSPVKHFTTVQNCIDNIVVGFPNQSNNFSTSLRAYRFVHHQNDPIQVDNGWLYICQSSMCVSDGYFHVSTKLRKDCAELCPVCYNTSNRTSIINLSKRKKQVPTNTRMPPITAMSTEELETAYKENQVKTSRTLQSNKRLCQCLERQSIALIIKIEIRCSYSSEKRL